MYRERVLSELAKAKRELRGMGVNSIELFGSVARGDDTPDSDIDLAVSVAPGTGFSLLDLVAVRIFLSERLGRAVDLVTTPVKNAALAKVIDGEGILAF